MDFRGWGRGSFRRGRGWKRTRREREYDTKASRETWKGLSFGSSQCLGWINASVLEQTAAFGEQQQGCVHDALPLDITIQEGCFPQLGLEDRHLIQVWRRSGVAPGLL